MLHQKSVNFSKVADTIEKYGAERKTSPLKFFLVTAALSMAAFVAARAAMRGAANKLDSKFGLFEKHGESWSQMLAKYAEKHPIQEGKGFKIYMNNKLNDLANYVLQYGSSGAKEVAAGVAKDAVKPNQAANVVNAVKQGISTVAGVSAAGTTIQNRYQDTDGNGVPDKAEGAIGTLQTLAKAATDIVGAI